MLILVAVEASSSVDKYGRCTLRLLVEAEHAVKSAIGSVRAVFRHGGGFMFVTVDHPFGGGCMESSRKSRLGSHKRARMVDSVYSHRQVDWRRLGLVRRDERPAPVMEVESRIPGFRGEFRI